MYQEGLKHHATYRDKNLLFEVLDDPKANRRVVLQAHWTAWLSPLWSGCARSDEVLCACSSPFWVPDIKQISHQSALEAARREIHLLSISPGRAISARRIKDFSHLRSTVTTGLAIDRQTVANGALRIIPKSHRLGLPGSFRRRPHHGRPDAG